jgi:hypothetical protein
MKLLLISTKCTLKKGDFSFQKIMSYISINKTEGASFNRPCSGFVRSFGLKLFKRRTVYIKMSGVKWNSMEILSQSCTGMGRQDAKGMFGYSFLTDVLWSTLVSFILIPALIHLIGQLIPLSTLNLPGNLNPWARCYL